MRIRTYRRLACTVSHPAHGYAHPCLVSKPPLKMKAKSEERNNNIVRFTTCKHTRPGLRTSAFSTFLLAAVVGSLHGPFSSSTFTLPGSGSSARRNRRCGKRKLRRLRGAPDFRLLSNRCSWGFPWISSLFVRVAQQQEIDNTSIFNGRYRIMSCKTEPKETTCKPVRDPFFIVCSFKNHHWACLTRQPLLVSTGRLPLVALRCSLNWRYTAVSLFLV